MPRISRRPQVARILCSQGAHAAARIGRGPLPQRKQPGSEQLGPELAAVESIGIGSYTHSPNGLQGGPGGVELGSEHSRLHIELKKC